MKIISRKKAKAIAKGAKRNAPAVIVMASCGLISAAVAPNCTYPAIGGLEVDIYLANKEEIASYTLNGSNALIVEAITMVASKKFYKYSGIKYSNDAKGELAKSKYSPQYDHEVDAVVFTSDGATKTQLEAMAGGLLVAIVEYKRKGAAGNSAYEILGREQGLVCQKLSRQANAEDGTYQIMLKTDDGPNKEGHLPAALFITSYAATAAVVAGLI